MILEKHFNSDIRTTNLITPIRKACREPHDDAISFSVAFRLPAPPGSSPRVIEKEQAENKEEPPSLEANKTTDPNTREAPWRDVHLPLGEAEHDDDTCRKVGMYVSFAKIGLSDEIIAPDGFDAFQCKGKCSSTQREKFSNRLTLVALLKKKKGTEIHDEACCVPTKLAPISALVFEKNGHTLLKKFDDMVVEECGCEYKSSH